MTRHIVPIAVTVGAAVAFTLHGGIGLLAGLLTANVYFWVATHLTPDTAHLGELE